MEKKKRRWGRRLLALTLGVAMVAGQVPAVPLAQLVPKVALAEQEPVSYLYWDEGSKSLKPVEGGCTDYTVVTNGMGELGASGQTTWYVVDGQVSMSSITVMGDVHLILRDYAQLTITGGGLDGSSGSNLTVHAQSEGDNAGKLSASSNMDEEGDGNNVAINVNGNVTINGGTVTASSTVASNEWAKAINVNGNVTINGGTVEATASNTASDGDPFADGIIASGEFTVNGGSVSASASSKYAYTGISSTNITVNGGTLSVEGRTGISTYGAGFVTFNGGEATVSSSEQAFAVAGEENVKTGPGTTVTAGNSADDASKVTSGLTNYKWVHIVSHIHSFAYAAQGDTITATCSATGCYLDDGTDQHNHVATLTIGEPASLAYDGTAKEATITDADLIRDGAKVMYQAKSGNTYGDATETAPTEAGTYKASITLGEATASVEFTITDDAHNITVQPSENGAVTADKATAKFGDTVTLTATPASDDYKLGDLTVTDGVGNAVTLQGEGDTRTFTMPASDVAVSATFAQKSHGAVTLTVTDPEDTGSEAALLDSSFKELAPGATVREGDRFVLRLNPAEACDFDLTLTSGSTILEAKDYLSAFSDEDRQAYAAYAQSQDIPVPSSVGLSWITMPDTGEEALSIKTAFAKQRPYTILYRCDGTPARAFCKFLRIEGQDRQVYVSDMTRDMTLGDGSAVWSLKVMAGFDPVEMAFATREQAAMTDEEAAALKDSLLQASYQVSSSTTVPADTDWTDVGGGKACLIGGNAKTAVAAFVTDPGSVAVYKSDDASFDVGSDSGAEYRIAVCGTDENGTVTTAGAVTAPAAPRREGYDFRGWSRPEGAAQDQKEKVYQPGESVSVSENTTLNAVWTHKDLNVALDLKGGSGDGGAKTVAYEGVLDVQEPTRSGYAFDGWEVTQAVTEGGRHFAKGTLFDLATPITADLQLKARWKHVHSYHCFRISDFGDALAAYEKYESAIHVAICECGDVKLAAHEFDASGKCSCGYQKPAPATYRLDVSYGQMSGGTYTEKMAGFPEEDLTKNQEVSISAPINWGNLKFSKWEYSTDDGNTWEDLTADAYASFLIPCNMKVRALYTNPVKVPQVELSAEEHIEQTQGWNWKNVMFQLDYQLPDGCSFVDAGIRLGDNAGISYYDLKEQTVSASASNLATQIGVCAAFSILTGSPTPIQDSYINNFYEECRGSAVDKLGAAELARYMWEGRPVSVEKYPPIYWDAKVPTKGMRGSITTMPPLHFIQKDAGKHYVYGIGWMRYRDAGGTVREIYTEALPTTRNTIPSYTVSATPDGKTNTKQ